MHVSHQATDWAITAGDALKRLRKETHRPANPAAHVAVHLRGLQPFLLSTVQEPDFTRGHSLGARCSEHSDHAGGD